MTEQEYEKEQDQWALVHIVSIVVLAVIGLIEFF